MQGVPCETRPAENCSQGTLKPVPTWQVQLLGDFRLTQGDQTITRFRTRPVDEIFAFLVLHIGQEVRREQLMAMCWPQRQTAAAQQNLRTALNNIRTLLGKQALESNRHTVRLVPEHFVVDAHDFKRTGNLSLYKGRLLEGMLLDWTLPYAQELEELYTNRLIKAMSEAEPAEAVAMGNDAIRRFPTLVAIRSKLRELDPAAQRKTPLAAPYTVNSFIGREQELATLQRMLQSHRLITLVGLGGAGKTRLASELWARHQPDSWFVPLVDIPKPSGIGDAIRHALKLPVSPTRSSTEQVIANLGEAYGLLVLDNFEHLLNGADIVTELLTGCPNLQIVVTSRERLDLPGELDFTVGSLLLAQSAQAELSEGELLFAVRATAAFPGFEINNENRIDIVNLCRGLDGFPLSIELAAAKSRLFSPKEMLNQLQDRFEFLTVSGSGSNRRQASLLDALDWSFDRLDKAEQDLLCRLSVFEGGFTLDAAASVCGASANGSQIDSLLTSAWVERAHSTGQTRFRLHESVREYGKALLKPHLLDELLSAHAHYYQALATKCFNRAFTPEEEVNFCQVRDDTANIEASWPWLSANDPEGALSLAVGLSWYWTLSGVPHIGEARVNEALARVPDEPSFLMAAAYHSNGTSLIYQGRLAESQRWYRMTNEVSALVNHQLYFGMSNLQIGWYHAELGEFEEAREYVGKGLELMTREENVSWGSAAYTVTALVSNRAGDAATAIEAGTKAVEWGRRGGYKWGLASALNELAMAHYLAGQFEQSVQCQQESIDLKEQSLTPASLALSYADLSATHLVLNQIDSSIEALKDWARLLLLLNDLESYPRAFATAGEIFAKSGNWEMANACRLKFLLLKEHGHRCASESLSYKHLLAALDAHVSPVLGPLSSEAILNAILAM